MCAVLKVPAGDIASVGDPGDFAEFSYGVRICELSICAVAMLAHCYRLVHQCHIDLLSLSCVRVAV